MVLTNRKQTVPPPKKNNRMDHHMDAYRSRAVADDRCRLVNGAVHHGACGAVRHYVPVGRVHADKLQVGVLCACHHGVRPARLPASLRRAALGTAVRNVEMVLSAGGIHPILLVCIEYICPPLPLPLPLPLLFFFFLLKFFY